MGESGFAEVKTARLAWWSDGPHHDDGDGDELPLVLVHAGVADARMWEPLLPALTPTRRVVRFDMRGYGETRAAPGAFTPPQDVVRVLDALGIARAHLVGASFGGLVALELAAIAPARVASLVLLAPALPDIEPSPELLAFAEAEEQAIRVEQIEDAVQINVRMWAGASAPEVQALVADMQRTAFALQLREGADPVEIAPPVTERLHDIAVPTTIATGDRDVIDFAHVAQRLVRELPDATHHEIADAGHLLALDQPAAVAQLILRHLTT